MRKKPAAAILAVVVTRHAARHVRAGVGDAIGRADGGRSGVGQTERTASVEEVGDARTDEAEDPRECQGEIWGTGTLRGRDWGQIPRVLEFYYPTPP